MTRRFFYSTALLLTVTVTSCVDPFKSSIESTGTDVLVVEGYIETGKGVTRINLSRSTGLENSAFVNEDEASVFIENSDGVFYTVNSKGDGLYQSDTLELDLEHEYRLRIELDEEVYLSEFVTPMVTPAIDSITWGQDPDQSVTIYANTHDPENTPHYYQWKFDEVWEIISPFYSFWFYQYPDFIPTTAVEIRAMHNCWRYRVSRDIIIANSAVNVNGVIQSQIVTRIPWQDERLRDRYSILVSQHVISQDEYDFLQIMEKNSTNLGGFFGSQPSALPGNIHAVSSNEKVVGNVGAYTATRSRIIIHNEDVVNWQYAAATCGREDSVYLEGLGNATGVIQGNRIVNILLDPETKATIGFTIVPEGCADCRTFPDSGAKPDFWVQEDMITGRKRNTLRLRDKLIEGE